MYSLYIFPAAFSDKKRHLFYKQVLAMASEIKRSVPKFLSANEPLITVYNFFHFLFPWLHQSRNVYYCLSGLWSIAATRLTSTIIILSYTCG